MSILRVAEFFCGIGGLRCGCTLLEKLEGLEAGKKFDIIAAFDVDTVSNRAYEFNFHERPKNVDIAMVTRQELDALAADVWLLSPPCQVIC
jgi:tRNA (cytosine38-C5)-methyltransferase